MAPIVARFEPPTSDGLRTAIAAFDCVRTVRNGEEDLGEVMVRDFLRSGDFAEAASAGTSTTYIATEPDAAPRQVVGYVTLALTQIRLTTGEKRADERLALVRVPDFGAIRIAMIGVDRRFAGQGYGKLLMDTVVLHTAQMSRDVSVRFIVADAVNTQLAWYMRQGFVENRSQNEIERLAGIAERTGITATSVRLDLGPDPRVLLPQQA